MKKNIGLLTTVTAGILWGFSGACGQFIFERFPIDPAHLTSIRMLCAGLILIMVGFITDKKSMVSIWQSKDACINLIVYAIFGIMFSQLTYMKAISYTNSGTATILQYTGPVLVMIASCAMQKRLPTVKETIAIILTVSGTFFIATHGDISSMVINTQGLIWGLLSAVALALYTLIPGKITKMYGSIAITAYGMIIGGIVLSIGSGIWNIQITFAPEFILAFIGIVIFGTILSYSLYLTGITLVGPVTASMLASVEPVSAAAFMIIWLNVPFHYMDAIGFTCILITVFLLAGGGASKKKS